MADGVCDDLEVSPRASSILLDRHVSFLEEHYHLLLDVAIDSPVDVFYPRSWRIASIRKAIKEVFPSAVYRIHPLLHSLY
jgi:hypothetical protein